ncbi:MAG: Uma2 family endonuclease [Pyrinomonadaceae bacterium]|nr:Uma2 family endonuclease [Pyrinomonadaceae bacterium]
MNAAAIEKILAIKPKEIIYPDSDGEPMAETGFHVNQILELIQTLKDFYKPRTDVFVTGNQFLFYEEGNPKKCVSPDVMVCFGVSNKTRRSYKIWEESDIAPSVVFEISSRKTFWIDAQKKWILYAQLGVKEYILFDPEYQTSMLADGMSIFKLVDGEYQNVELENNRVFSEALGLEIIDTGDGLRLFDPKTQKLLLNSQELSTEVSDLNNEVQELTGEVQELTGEVQELTGEVQELTGEVQELTGELNEERQARENAERELEKLKAELSKFKEK